MQGGQRWQARPACPIAFSSIYLYLPAAAACSSARRSAAMGHGPSRSATSQFARQHFLCGHDQIVSADVRSDVTTCTYSRTIPAIPLYKEVQSLVSSWSGGARGLGWASPAGRESSRRALR
jgi:hypothetical protein